MNAAAVTKRQQTLQRKLLAWYDRNGRDLPWRRSKDPYAVWLSEIMLQQTQVATVMPYYERFVRRFPTVHVLAAARIDAVLKLWAGLGYYSRARNLHKAAAEIVREHDGRFPDSVEALRTLPGIGRYTAAAIASICFGRRAAVVDGNVIRVLTRLFNISDDVRKPATVNRLWGIADSHAPARRCGDYNQAIMELGATVCTPGATARCDICPLQAQCAARKAQTVAELPRKSAKAVVRHETHIVAAICADDRWLIRRRPSDGLWGGLWELPSAQVSGAATVEAVRRLARSLGVPRCTVSTQPFCVSNHQLSHRLIRFTGYRCSLQGTEAADSMNADLRWVTLAQFSKLGISQAMRRIAEALGAGESNDRGTRSISRRQSRHGKPVRSAGTPRAASRRIA
ncbi:MAG: A/G-specific adenine glycosylase [Planctomycetes bacterium]|nr:A/G-specific adenine glycosylase [Planctomycetota bacterium]